MNADGFAHAGRQAGVRGASLEVRDLGLMGYRKALDLQQELMALRRDDRVGNTVLIVEHPPVITLGARKTENRLLTDEGLLEERGIELLQVRRGGGTTAHNPGQLVYYPILKLKPLNLGVTDYVRRLEQIGIELLADFGVTADRKKGFPGLWVEDRKIASVGVQISRWVTFHGMAINFNNDLSIFEYMVPCGLDGVVMTSVQRETGAEADLDRARRRLADLCRVHLQATRAECRQKVNSLPG